MGKHIQGLGFGVWTLRFRVYSSGFGLPTVGVRGSACAFWDSGLWVQGSELGFLGFWFRDIYMV